MKLSFHERILVLSTILFTAFILMFSLLTVKSPNVFLPAEKTATPYYININSATAEELDSLDGIGPAIASKIIKYREENGDFKTITDLANVSGISTATVNKIKDYIKI
ncbi:MAG: ComEA family DNA-binding protein [Oscillospiraceae bacterium]|nr:ComEA family DNA-binding protein [Oscillospiraceae bacterium]